VTKTISGDQMDSGCFYNKPSLFGLQRVASNTTQETQSPSFPNQKTTDTPAPFIHVAQSLQACHYIAVGHSQNEAVVEKSKKTVGL
jgi:hypothetical protein